MWQFRDEPLISRCTEEHDAARMTTAWVWCDPHTVPDVKRYFDAYVYTAFVFDKLLRNEVKTWKSYFQFTEFEYFFWFKPLLLPISLWSSATSSDKQLLFYVNINDYTGATIRNAIFYYPASLKFETNIKKKYSWG